MANDLIELIKPQVMLDFLKQVSFRGRKVSLVKLRELSYQSRLTAEVIVRLFIRSNYVVPVKGDENF